MNLKTLKLGGTLPSLTPLAMRLVATLLWLQATDQRRNLWLNKVCVHTDSEIEIHRHNHRQSWQFSLHSKSVYCLYTVA